MNQFKRSFVDGPYGQTHYRIKTNSSPEKRPLVCLHMFPQSSRNFETFLNHYPANRTVVAPDFPGYGESDCPAEQITASDYAAAIWGAIDSLSLLDDFASLDLFGIHAGAKLATELASQRPDEVNHLVLSSAAVLYPEELAELKKAFEPVPLDEAGTRLNQLWQLLIRNQGPGQTLEMLANSLAEIMRSGENYEWGHYAVYEFNTRFPDVLRSLEHPIALMNINDDLYEMTPRTEPYLANGKMYEFSQWGYGFLDIHAAEVAQVVDQLLENPLNFRAR